MRGSSNGARFSPIGRERKPRAQARRNALELCRVQRSAGERELARRRSLLEPRLACFVRLGLAEHHQAPLFAGDDFSDRFITATTASSCSAMVSDLSYAASASIPDGTADIAIGEGVAVADEHRRSVRTIAS